MKHNIKNNYSIFFPVSSLLLFALLLLMASCNKKEPYLLPIEQVNGLLVNRIDNSPIANYRVTLITEFGFIGGGSSIDTHTNNNGEFKFYESGTLNLQGHWNEIPNINYQQWGIWINDKPDVDELYGLFGVRTEFNSDGPMEIKFGLYPETYYKLHLTNTAPASESDSFKIRFNNSSPNSFWSTGILVDSVRQWKTTVGNILTINYDVVHNGNTESFIKIVECIPGDTTDIYLEY